MSSSAHTDGVLSQSDELTTISLKKQHGSKKQYSDSINTSDINIISVE
jgi:hypothetical protein